MAQVIMAPSDEPARHGTSVFLAGSTAKVGPEDWRLVLTTALAGLPVTVFNPLRADWDASWREDVDFAPFREQVEWELERQARADLVVVYLHPATQAPVSLVEFGLWARVPGKVVVVCPEGFWKRGNVLLVARRFGVEVVDTVEGLAEVVARRVADGGGGGGGGGGAAADSGGE